MPSLAFILVSRQYVITGDRVTVFGPFNLIVFLHCFQPAVGNSCRVDAGRCLFLGLALVPACPMLQKDWGCCVVPIRAGECWRVPFESDTREAPVFKLFVAVCFHPCGDERDREYMCSRCEIGSLSRTSDSSELLMFHKTLLSRCCGTTDLGLDMFAQVFLCALLPSIPSIQLRTSGRIGESSWCGVTTHHGFDEAGNWLTYWQSWVWQVQTGGHLSITFLGQILSICFCGAFLLFTSIGFQELCVQFSLI